MWRASQVKLNLLVSGLLVARFCSGSSITLLDKIAAGAPSLSSADFAGSQSRFQEGLKFDHSDAGVLLGRAADKFSTGDPKEVEKYLRQALAAAPQKPDVYRAWGRFLAIQKRFPEAEKSFQQAVALSHHGVSAEMDLGDFYILGPHKVKQAMDSYREVLSTHPDHAGAHFAMGVALAGLGNTAEAETELQQATRLAADRPFAPQALGELYLRRQQYDKALEAFTTAVNRQADFVPAYVGKGDALWGKGDATKASAEYATAVKLAPNEPALQIKIGMLDQWFGKRQAAEQAYLAAIRLDPKAAVAYNNLAWMAVEKNTDLAQARKWAQAAVDLNPSAAAFQVTLAWTYRAAKDLGRAASILEKSAAANPQSPDILYRLGIVYSEVGKTREAAASLEKALPREKDTREADDIRKRLAVLRPPAAAQSAPHSH